MKPANMTPANMTDAERVEHVLDKIGGTIDFGLELRGAQSAFDCLCDSSTLEEIRLSLQDLDAAAREIRRLTAQARRVLQATSK